MNFSHMVVDIGAGKDLVQTIFTEATAGRPGLRIAPTRSGAAAEWAGGSAGPDRGRAAGGADDGAVRRHRGGGSPR